MQDLSAQVQKLRLDAISSSSKLNELSTELEYCQAQLKESRDEEDNLQDELASLRTEATEQLAGNQMLIEVVKRELALKAREFSTVQLDLALKISQAQDLYKDLEAMENRAVKVEEEFASYKAQADDDKLQAESD